MSKKQKSQDSLKDQHSLAKNDGVKTALLKAQHIIWHRVTFCKLLVELKKQVHFENVIYLKKKRKEDVTYNFRKLSTGVTFSA